MGPLEPKEIDGLFKEIDGLLVPPDKDSTLLTDNLITY